MTAPKDHYPDVLTNIIRSRIAGDERAALAASTSSVC
jgi:hypothetical protein